jgi:hypothetical protein
MKVGKFCTLQYFLPACVLIIRRIFDWLFVEIFKHKHYPINCLN